MKPQYIIRDIPFPETEGMERQVIADVIQSPYMMGDVQQLIHKGFFTNPDRQSIWELIEDHYNKGLSFDMQTIAAEIGKPFFDEILPGFSDAGGTVSVIQHAALLRTGAARRRAYCAAISFLENAMNPKNTEEDILSSTETLSRLVEGEAPLMTEKKPAQGISDVKEEAQKIKSLKEQGKTIRIPTGFHYLDDCLNKGFKPGQLIILAARPSVGKTAVMLQLAKTAADSDNPVLLFSLEMTCPELCERLIFSTGEVQPYQLANGDIEWQAFALAEDILSPLPIYINDFSRSLDEIVSRLTRAVKQGRCKIAFIDYLGLIQDTLNPGYNKLYQIIAKITGELKAVAKRLGIPIVLLCQLNRDQAREKRAPELFDLRDSGSIEQDADIVIMLEPRYDEGRIFAWLRKNRNGPRDVALVLVPNKTYSAFEEGLPVQELRTPCNEPVSNKDNTGDLNDLP